ncbi:MAG: two-component regulator propeller domain-containing protein, partial [Eubacteriales bacterium]
MTKRTYFNGQFEQRTRSFFSVAEGLPAPEASCLAFDSKGTLFVGTAKGLARLEGKKIIPVSLKLPQEDCAVSMLFGDSRGRIWAGSSMRLFCINDKKVAAMPSFNKPVVSMGEGEDGALWLLTEDYLYKMDNDAGEFKEVIDVPGIGNCLAVTGLRNVYVGTKKSGLLGLIGKRHHWAELFEEFTGILSNSVNCVSFDSTGYLWVGTSKGLCVYDGKGHWLSAKEVPCIPKGCINDMVVGADGSRWFATTTGLVLLKEGALKYYGFKRWVPSPDVKAVAISANGTVCAATNEGLSLIETQMMTLEDKARHYQKTVEKYHVRKDGYVTVRFLDVPGEIENGYVEVSDNDGTWTAMYMACQAYRYGATGEKDALENARRTFKALQKLTVITDIPGFTAR